MGIGFISLIQNAGTTAAYRILQSAVRFLKWNDPAGNGQKLFT
jgi:hypothetical protein